MRRQRPRLGTARNPWTREEESGPCRTCGAAAGSQCLTRTGRPAARSHAPRYAQAVARTARDKDRSTT